MGFGHRELLDFPCGRYVLTRRIPGFTLIELMVVVAIIGILLMLGTPLFSQYVANSRIRAAAEAFANAVAQARTEAIKRNESVEFLVSNGWLVCKVADSAASNCTQGNPAVLFQGAGKEGIAEVTATVTPAGSTRVAFDSFGRTIAVSPVDASAALTQVDFDVPNGTAVGSRPLRVLLETGGAVKLCDPAVTPPDPRGCA